MLIPDGERMIGVGLVDIFRSDEPVARNRAHSGQDRGIVDPSALQLFVNHPHPAGDEVDLRGVVAFLHIDIIYTKNGVGKRTLATPIGADPHNWIL